MNKAIEALLSSLLNKRKIGGSHTPENKAVMPKTKWLSDGERKEFENEYRNLLNQGVLLRMKKRTGKGDDWHISLNPRKLREIYDILRRG